MLRRFLQKCYLISVVETGSGVLLACTALWGWWVGLATVAAVAVGVVAVLLLGSGIVGLWALRGWEEEG